MVFMPQAVKQAYYRRVLGWRIGKNVRIGLSLILADEVVIGDNVTIRGLNYWHGLHRLVIGNNVTFQSANGIYADAAQSERFPRIVTFGNNVFVGSRHYIDACGVVDIQDGAVIAGRGTCIWSHTLRPTFDTLRMEALNVRVGKGVYVGANAVLVGCDLPDNAVVAAGSVVPKRYPAEAARLLIGGNPARVIKRYAPPDNAAPTPAPRALDV